MKPGKYDKFPAVTIPGRFEVFEGWPRICRLLSERWRARPRVVLTVDTYPGVNDAELLGQLEAGLRPALTIRTVDLKRAEPDLVQSIGRNLTEDRIFGVLSCHRLEEFFKPDQLASARARVASQREGVVLIYGVGAELVARGDVLVYADMARWEIQLRYRRGASNWGAENGHEDFFRKYKRGFFVEWRAADRHKFELFERMDFFLDTHVPDATKLVEGR